jgi:hypothetical protein
MKKELIGVKPLAVVDSVSNIPTKWRCITCGGQATKIALFQVEGATTIQRYCDTCITSNKHLETSELITNYDNYFSERKQEGYWPTR